MENYSISLFKGYADTCPTEVTLENSKHSITFTFLKIKKMSF